VAKGKWHLQGGKLSTSAPIALAFGIERPLGRSEFSSFRKATYGVGEEDQKKNNGDEFGPAFRSGTARAR
jgi:hypothetical protein